MRVAINGMGRIGRLLGRRLLHLPGVDLVAVNDIMDTENLVYLFRYDSIYGTLPGPVQLREGKLLAAGKEIAIFREADPTRLHWKQLGVDIVLECSGRFSHGEGANLHRMEQGEITGGKLDQLVIAAVPVDDQDLAKSIGDERGDQIADDGVVGLGANGHGRAECEMVIGRAERQRGSHDDGAAVGCERGRGAADVLDREGVGAGGEMRSVLLGGANGQHDQAGWSQLAKGGAVELIEERGAVGHHVRDHNAPASQARAVCLPP